jgi:hypothetical protein
VSYAAGGVLLGVALALAIGFAIWPSATLARVATLFSILTVLYAAWWFLLDDHTSGLVLGAAALGALALAASAIRRQLAAPRVSVGTEHEPTVQGVADRQERDPGG